MIGNLIYQSWMRTRETRRMLDEKYRDELRHAYAEFFAAQNAYLERAYRAAGLEATCRDASQQLRMQLQPRPGVIALSDEDLTGLRKSVAELWERFMSAHEDVLNAGAIVLVLPKMFTSRWRRSNVW